MPCTVHGIHTVVQPSPPSISRVSSSFQTKTLFPLKHFPALLSSNPSTPHSTFRLYKFDHCRCLRQVESHSTCPFVTGLFHLAKYLQGSSMLQPVLEFPPFSRLSNILLSIWTTPCLSIYLSTHAHLGCFYFLAAMKKAAMNMGEHL